ncbi:MAG TPA: hypothetical protein VJS66_04135 [Burkholderiales bacterium]|nr:hypothetical protein [Burkholderiales bacterium]
MKQPRSTKLKHSPEPTGDLYQDETQAMVYVGDVYSLVAQGGVAGGTAPEAGESNIEKPNAEQSNDDGNNDALLPFIR